MRRRRARGGCLCWLVIAARHCPMGVATRGGPSRRTQGRSRPPGSARTHRTASEGLPGAFAVARRAVRPASADALCPTSTVRGRTVNNRPEAAPSVFSGASAAPRNAELAHRTPSGAKNGSCAVQLLSSMAPRPRLARKKRLRCVGLHPCELSRHESLLIRR